MGNLKTGKHILVPSPTGLSFNLPQGTKVSLQAVLALLLLQRKS